MFSQFTADARNVLDAANRQATERQHDFIGSGHILLAMLIESSEAVTIVRDVHIDPQAVHFLVTKLLSDAATTDADSGKAVIEAATQQARELRHEAVGTPHLFLGILDLPDCLAACVLAALCADVEPLRRAALRRIADLPKAAPLPPWEPYKDHQEIKPLIDQLAQLNRRKESAVAARDFEQAARFRDEAHRLIMRINDLLPGIAEDGSRQG